jgi:ribonuclease HI
MSKPRKFYVVWRGRKTGIFDTWADCAAQVQGAAGAQFASFETRAEAECALAGRYEDAIHPKPSVAGLPPEVAKGYSVDAACDGSPGNMEYRCVKNDTRAQIFHQGPFEQGTNNVGEFLAIVHALAHFKKHGINAPLYSDSRTALAWVRDGACKTELARTERNAVIFDLIARAEAWLRDNQYSTPVRKWNTAVWGENPADFGRK